jgi:hypothetical protein
MVAIGGPNVIAIGVRDGQIRFPEPESEIDLRVF